MQLSRSSARQIVEETGGLRAILPVFHYERKAHIYGSKASFHSR